MFKKFEMELAGRTLRVDVDRVAKQANGAVLMHYGDTTVLCTATASDKPRDGIDFFPLSVEYNERMYSVGKIPGGFNKREGKASENAILTDRVIDRPMRPLFPKDYRNDVTLENLVMAVDQDCSPELTAMLGAALATSISDIPFDGPISTTQVGLVDGEFVFNPTAAQKVVSDLALTVASTKEKVIMIEAGAKEVPEDKMIEANGISSTDAIKGTYLDNYKIRSLQSAERKSTSIRVSQFRRNYLMPSRKSLLRQRWKKLYLQTTSRQEKKISVSLLRSWKRHLPTMKNGLQSWVKLYISTRKRP